MKKLSFILAAILSLQLAFVMGVSAEITADTSKEALLYQDFENYEMKDTMERKPGTIWYLSEARKDFEPIKEGDNTVLRIGGAALPVFYFGDLYQTGKLHISFDIKFAEEAQARLYLFDGRIDEKVNYYNDDPYVALSTSNAILSNIFQVKETQKCLIFYYDGSGGADMTSWRADIMPEYEKDMTEWTHVDLYFDEISNTRSRANYYFDGKLVNTAPISFSRGVGFKAFAMTNQATEDVFLDNIYVHRYYDAQEDLGSVISNDGFVDNETRELEIKFAEPVEGNISSENIVITRDSDGEQISNFTVEEVTDASAKIVINEELQAGMYNINISDIAGKYSKNTMIKGKTFRTAYRTVNIIGDLYNEDFNSYTADENAWPAGWVTDTNLNTTNSAVRSVSGASGEDGDLAFGMEVANDLVRRPIYNLLEAIPKSSDIEISFDVKTDGAEWGIHLLNSSTANDDRDTEVLGMSKDDFTLKYASSLKSGADTVIEESLQLTEGQWHNVKLSIKPQDESSALYTVSVDGGEEFTAEASRNFFAEPITRIGVGVTGKDPVGTLAIDNLNVKAFVSTMQPEVESIVLIDNLGGECDTGKAVPIEVEQVKVTFNTAVYDGNVDDIFEFKDGEGNKVDYFYEFSVDKKSLTLTLSEPLSSNTNYTIEFNEELTSAISSGAKAPGIFRKAFVTENNNGMYEIYNQRFVESDDKISYAVDIAKTNFSEYRYIMAIAGYTYDVKDDGTSFEVLEAVNVTPIILDESARGYFSFGKENSIKAKIDEETDYDVIKAYIFEYPLMKLVSVEEKTE